MALIKCRHLILLHNESPEIIGNHLAEALGINAFEWKINVIPKLLSRSFLSTEYVKDEHVLYMCKLILSRNPGIDSDSRLRRKTYSE